jgi:dynein heavy chain
MYQFSLDWYKNLFDSSIKESKEQLQSGERVDVITNYHKLQVYKHACRSLFEKHKLLLSMQMCIKL